MPLIAGQIYNILRKKIRLKTSLVNYFTSNCKDIFPLSDRLLISNIMNRRYVVKLGLNVLNHYNLSSFIVEWDLKKKKGKKKKQL